LFEQPELGGALDVAAGVRVVVHRVDGVGRDRQVDDVDLGEHLLEFGILRVQELRGEDGFAAETVGFVLDGGGQAVNVEGGRGGDEVEPVQQAGVAGRGHDGAVADGGIDRGSGSQVG